MTTLIIRDIDDQVGLKLKLEAARLNTSVNKLARQLLSQAMMPQSGATSDLARFAGIWSTQQADEILSLVAQSDATSLAVDWH